MNANWLRFSGIEQDTESGLYYFGARYYDPSLYRFLSPDPIIPTDRALYNPQRWNLYGYCLGNPINYVDISGGQARRLIVTRTISGPTGTFGHFRFEGKYLTIEGDTLELPWMGNKNDKSCIPEGNYEAILHYWDRKDKEKENIWVLWLQNTGSHKGIFVHGGSTTEDTTGCMLIGKGFDNVGNLTGGQDIRKAILTDHALDLIFSAWFPLEWLSRDAHKTSVKVEKGKVYCEWQWVGYIDYINGIVYYFN
jgi:RHS repeat-associated protein